MARSRKLPALQFYPGDWRKDAGVQSLDYFSRGVWFELLLMMHECEDRGRLAISGSAISIESLAQILGLPPSKAKQAISKILANGVASQDSSGVVYSRRMVKDERIREARRRAGRSGGLAKAVAKARSSSSSSSSSSYSVEEKKEEHTLPPAKRNGSPDPTPQTIVTLLKTEFNVLGGHWFIEEVEAALARSKTKPADFFGWVKQNVTQIRGEDCGTVCRMYAPVKRVDPKKESAVEKWVTKGDADDAK